MSTLVTQYDVVLRSGLPPRERELLEQACCKITSDSGPDLLHFLCTEIDLSHPFYIEMQTFKPGAEWTHPLRISHHFVFLILGSVEHAAIGFLTGPGAQKEITGGN
jgi:hypothetical protein